MKTLVFILLCFLTVSASKAQVNDLIGTWTVFEMTQISGQTSEKMTEDQFKANGAFEDYFFMEESKFKQTGNLSGEGAVSTQEGTWKIMENKVIMTLQLGEKKMDVDYTYELKENKLFLTRTSPDGNIKIIMVCRKK
jgi:Lipocalin-like domain